MSAPAQWWHTAPVKGLASLAVALAITFLPMFINKVRARSHAPAVEIIASPGVVADTARSQPCDTAATDSGAACKPTADK